MLRYYGLTMFNVPGMGNIAIPDTTKFASIAAKYKNAKYWLKYTIREGERPEQIALRLYGSESLWYLIYLYNGMDDIMNDWPMTEMELREHISKKWPDNEPGETHHYVDELGVVQSPLAISILRGITVESAIALEGLTPISIEDYERGLNEARRNIVLLDPDWVGPVDRELRDEFRRTSTR
ncbi:baseplate wedge component gp53 [Delftia phage PhiW-14]|uniref:Baseplate wedge component gp53 n=1 Tax=Delftia phage PhiW-14 TaxID=665032 RepID=C9DFX8_BPW14|nr:baseplate wedge component gp53 [Delftia phage PhiW-14]ACV50029.1 baseplate wedge component gp53 [Delftia phage PhiW-14]